MSLRARFVFALSLISLFVGGAASAQTLSSLAVTPATITLGSNGTGTVTLTGAAPAGGKVVTLSSNDTGAATVPANVTVPQGATSATFTITAVSVTTNKTPTITATLTAVKTQTITVLPLFASFALNQTTALGGVTNPTGTLTLNGPAPAGGTSVTLTSSAPTKATVPASVTVPAGTSLFTFSVTTLASAGSTTITAVSGGVSKAAPALSVTTSPVPLSVSFAQASIRGGQTTTGTVTLNGPASGTGAVVTLTSGTTTIATVPANVTVPAGAISATFTATGVSAANGSSTITAALNAVNATASLAVTPNPALLSVTFPVASIKASGTATGTVSLNALATASSLVSLAAAPSGAYTVPANVTIASGASSATFTATAVASPTVASATTTATYSSVNKTAVLGVTTTPTLMSVSLSANPVLGGGTSTATVKLNANAASATTVSLYSSNTAIATVPASVVIASGASSATFTVTSIPVGARTDVLVAAVSGGVTVSTPLTVTPPVPTGVSLNPTSVPSGGTSNGTVTISGAAPTGGLVLSLGSANTAVATVPATVTVAAGATTAPFTVTALTVASSTNVAISATRTGVTASATLTVTPAPAALSSLSFSPTSVTGGTSSTGTVTLTSAAGAGGVVVSLSSPNAAVVVPASVTVSQGATTQTFTATTTPVGVATPVLVTATYSAVNKTATLTVNPPSLSSVSLSPTAVTGTQTSTGTVTLGSAAPTNGIVVSLSSANTNIATVPASVTVPSGATTATFTATSLAVGAQAPVVLTATLNAVNKTATLTVNPPALTALALNPTTVAAPATSTGTVTLGTAAPTAGIAVSLSSANTNIVTVPASVTVAGGATTATFTASTLQVGAQTPVVLTATWNGTNKTATLTVNPCVPAVAPPPSSLPSSDIVFIEDAAPNGGVQGFVWDTTQKASGTQSHTDPAAPGEHHHLVDNTTPQYWIGPDDTLVAYILVDSCSPPREVMLQWFENGSWEHRAFWGEDLIALGVSGTASRATIGGLTPAGQWTRVEVAAYTVGLQDKLVNGFQFNAYDGHVWFDRIAKKRGPGTPVLTGFTLSPASIVSGGSTTATLTLSQPATAGMPPVQIGTSDTNLSFPSSVSVPAGQTSVTFQVDTPVMTSAVNATLTAAFDGTFLTANLAVEPIALTGLSVSPSTINGGNSGTATITATAIPPGGLGITLSSSDPAVATVPGGVWITEGTSTTFPVTTTVVASATNVTITATAGASSVQTTITVDHCTPSVATPPASFPAGDVVWMDDALPGGNPQDFVWDTSQKASGTQSHTDVAVDGYHQHLVDGMPAFWVAPNDKLVTYVLLDPCNPPQEFVLSWLGNGDWEHRAYWGADLLEFATRVPMGALPAAGVWTRLEIPAATLGLQDALVQGLAFTEFSGHVWFDRSGKLRDASTPTVASLTFSPTSSVGGATVTGTLTLTSAATPGMPHVVLASNSAHFTVPAEVAFAAGSTTQTFTATALQATAQETATVTATLDGTSASGQFTLQPIPITDLTLTPASLVGGLSGTGRVTMGAYSYGAGPVTLTSSPAGLVTFTPSSLNVDGALQVNFSYTTVAVANATDVTVTATFGPSTFSRTLTLQPRLQSLSIPTALVGGRSVSAAIVLGAAAPTGGYTVALTSSNPSVAPVPASVTVAAGATVGNFSIAVADVTSDTPVTFTATAESVSKTVNSVVSPFGVSAITFDDPAPRQAGQLNAHATVQLDAPAPSGGTVVTLSLNYGTPSPATVVVSQGASSASFTYTVPWRGIDYDLTMTASYGVTAKSATIHVLKAIIPFSLTPGSAQRGGSVWGYFYPTTLPSCPAVDLSGADLTIFPAQTNVPSDVQLDQAGQYVCRVLVSVAPNAANGTTTLTLTWNGASGTAPITVLPSNLVGFALHPSAVPAGTATYARITLDAPAPYGGASIALTSSDPAAIPVPATFLVPQGTTSVTFPITPQSVTPSTVTLMATYGTATLTAKAKGLSANAATITGTVVDAAVFYVDKVLPGVRASIASDPDDSTFTDANGQFSLFVEPGDAAVTLSLPNYASQTSAHVTPAAQQAVSLGKLALPRLLGVGTLATFGHVKNAAGQPIVGATLQPIGYQGTETTDANGAYSIAAIYETNTTLSLRVAVSAAGYATQVIPVRVKRANEIGFSGQDVTMDTSPVPTLLSLYVPALVETGQTINVVSNFSGSAPAGDAWIAYDFICEATPFAPICHDWMAPTWVAGQAGINLTFPYLVVSDNVSPKPFIVGTFYGGVEKRAYYTAIPQGWTGVSMITTPDPVTSGQTVSASLDLNHPAPTGGAVVTLSASDARVTLPASVTVAEGQTHATFNLSCQPLTTTTEVLLSATYNQVTTKRTVTFLNAVPRVSALGLAPSSLAGGSAATGTVTLTMPAEAGGASVALTSSDPVAVVPTSVLVAAGSTQATFPITTSLTGTQKTVVIGASFGGGSASAALGVNPPPPPTLAGVAPGIVMAGDATPLLYGTNFLAGTRARIEGPVYATDRTTVLCNLGQAQCAAWSLTGAASSDGTQLAFAVPSGFAPGVYYLHAINSLGTLSPSGVWLMVADPSVTYPAITTPEEHQVAKPLVSGQMVVGTFLDHNDPTNLTNDYNFYFFVATAGSHVRLHLERVDDSIPWENPASLDPKISVYAPDGYVYWNLEKEDDFPGSDLNATIEDAVLPLTGMYAVSASTSRGAGQYRLTYTLLSSGPAPAGYRAIAVGQNGMTVPTNTVLHPFARMLDPRGYSISGAHVAFQPNPANGDTGDITFPDGASAVTGVDGNASNAVKVLGLGKTRFGVVHTDVTLSLGTAQQLDANGRPLPEGAAPLVTPETIAASVARYQPVGFRSLRGLQAGPHGTVDLGSAPAKALKPQPVFPRREEFARPGAKGLSARPGFGSERTLEALPQAARHAVPLAPVPLVITSCSADTTLFNEAGVSAPEVKTPFTLTLTDKTPSTGQSTENGEVTTTEGIHGHRIEKKIRLKIEIKDSTGSAPTYPVLVNLALGGARHGKVILDPDGAKVECESGSFIWHEQDAQGQTVALNEEIEYKLGTFANYVGVKPDPNAPTQVIPVWGETETLAIQLVAVNAQGQVVAAEKDYPVHPEPGKPALLGRWSQEARQNGSGAPEPDTYLFWNGYYAIPAGTNPDGSPGFWVEQYLWNAYYLADQYLNLEFGYTNASVTPPSTNITPHFESQLNLGSGDFIGYVLTTRWNNNPTWPLGLYPATLSVSYTDQEWGSGTVSTTFTYDYRGGQTHAVIRHLTYEKMRPDLLPGTNDGPFPLPVSPDAQGDGLPKTDIGDGHRLALLLVKGTKTSGDLPQPNIYRDGHTVWSKMPNQGGGYHWEVYKHLAGEDPVLEWQDEVSFRMSLVDLAGRVATDGQFRVNRCPRYDHESPNNPDSPRPCTLEAVDSVDGVIPSVTINPAQADDPAKASYIGLELLHAPKNPGYYYVKLEALGGKQYWLQYTSDSNDTRDPAGEFKGAFALCNVKGVEILDSNFNRVPPNGPPLAVEGAKTLYLSYTDGSGLAVQPGTITVSKRDSSGSQSTDMTLTRLGSSNRYLGAFVLTEQSPTGRHPHPLTIPPVPIPLPFLLGEFVGKVQSQTASARFRRGHLAVDSVGFSNDIKLVNWLTKEPIDPNNDVPLWRSDQAPQPNWYQTLGAAYVSGASPTVFAKFKTSTPLSPDESYVATLTVTDDQNPQYSATGTLTLNSTAIAIRDLHFSPAWNYSNTMTRHMFKWSLDFGYGYTVDAGKSGEHKLYWIVSDRVSKPYFADSRGNAYEGDELYDKVIESALDPQNDSNIQDLPDKSDMPLRLTQLLSKRQFFDPGHDWGALHPFRIWDQNNPGDPESGVNSDGLSILLVGMLRSIGVNADLFYVWAGNGSQAYLYKYERQGSTPIDVSFQARWPEKGRATQDPHYSTHMFVQSMGHYYDPSYGLPASPTDSYDGPEFLESYNIPAGAFVFNSNLLQSFGLFSPAPIYAGATCGHH